MSKYVAFKTDLENLIDKSFGPGWRDLCLEPVEIIKALYERRSLEDLI